MKCIAFFGFGINIGTYLGIYIFPPCSQDHETSV